MKKKFSSFFILTVFLISLFFIPFGSAEGTWTTKQPMPTARGYLDVASINDRIYAIGGSGPTGVNEAYNPASDNWTVESPMPNPEQGFAIAVYQGKIYCIGGISNSTTGQNEVYDPTTNSWKAKAPMPTERYGLQANVVNGLIYCMGGVRLLGYDQGVEQVNVTEIYDPTNDKWTTSETLIPPNASECVSAVLNNKIYLINSAATNIYDPTIDKWSRASAPPLPFSVELENGLSATSAATTGVQAPKRIYVYDGINLQVYDPANDSWTKAPPPPTSRQYLGIGVVKDTLYFIGGFTFTSPGIYNDFATNEQYTPLDYGITPGSKENILSVVIPVLVFIIATFAVIIFFVVAYKKYPLSLKNRGKNKVT